jgi:AraC family transcriptional regulator
MKPVTGQDYHERTLRALVYIQQHLDDDLELEQVAAAAAFSRFHFHRVFRALVGEPLKEHVRRLRLERAAGQLKRLDEPIVRIALDAGFETHESFTRAFAAMFGTSPSNYRAAHKPAPDSPSGTHFDDLGGFHPPCGAPPPAVEVREEAPFRVVFLRHVGPYDKVGATWGRLMSWAGPRGLLGPGMKMIGLCHDDPEVTPPDKLRYDAAVAVSRPVRPEGEFGVLELPGGKYAVATHKGPHDTLGRTYAGIYGGWLPKSGYDLRDSPAFEEYLNSPTNARPEDLLTLIHVPVE